MTHTQIRRAPFPFGGTELRRRFSAARFGALASRLASSRRGFWEPRRAATNTPDMYG